MGGKIFNGKDDIVFGPDQYLTENDGYYALPDRQKGILLDLEPMGTPRGFKIYVPGTPGHRKSQIEIRPEGVFIPCPNDPAGEVQISSRVSDLSLLDGFSIKPILTPVQRVEGTGRKGER